MLEDPHPDHRAKSLHDELDHVVRPERAEHGDLPYGAHRVSVLRCVHAVIV